MANEVTEAVIRKIQKLLELGSRAEGNEEEAAAAMAKAQEIMASYNLDMSIVRDTQVAGGTTPEETKRDRKIVNRSAMYDWQKDLWRTVAECNFCWYSTTTVFEPIKNSLKTRKLKRHTIIGSVANVTMVHLMGEYLCDTIERLLPIKDNKARLSREAISWRAGCAYRIQERLHRQRWDRQKAAREQDGSGETGLALRNVETVEYIGNYDFLYGKGAYDRMLARQKEEETKIVPAETFAQMKARQAQEEKDRAKWRKESERADRERSRKYDNGAFAAGYVKGNDVGIHSQVSTTTNPKLL